MQTAPLHLSGASSGQRGWASVGVAFAAGALTVLRGLGLSVLAKCICAAQLVPSLKSGCHEQRAFGRVKSAAVCTGTILVWGEGGAPTAVATANVRSNTAYMDSPKIKNLINSSGCLELRAVVYPAS